MMVEIGSLELKRGLNKQREALIKSIIRKEREGEKECEKERERRNSSEFGC